MVTRTPNLCMSCKHLKPAGGYDPTRTCTAYPQAIPADIYNNGADHRLVRLDQSNDIVYEMIKGGEVIFNMWANMQKKIS